MSAHAPTVRTPDREHPDMANWVKPDWSRKEVRRAGSAIVELHEADRERQANDGPPLPHERFAEYSKAIGLVFSYRAAHAFPLNTVQLTLRRKARSLDSSSVVAQRLKRFFSIIGKLERFPHMGLDTMQDIGGCRAIMPTVQLARRLSLSYENSPRLKHRLGDRKKDYIANPKPDGYRSIHLIYRCESKSPTTALWNGFQVEIQIRSKLQHAWAAAVETVDLFTRQSMKTGAGIPKWGRFMALMSGAIAHEELTPPIPNTPTDRDELLREIHALHDELDVSRRFAAWRLAVVDVSDKRTKKDRYFLIEIDLSAERILVRSYGPGESMKANADYEEVEKRLKDRNDAQVVLAGSGSFDSVEVAFPAYFNDSRLFIEILERTLRR